MDFTFKENVVDIRNSQVADIIAELQSFGITVQLHDPLADPIAVAAQYGLKLLSEHDLVPADAIILAVAHDSYRSAGWRLVKHLLKSGRGLVVDVKGMLDPLEKPIGVRIWRL